MVVRDAGVAAHGGRILGAMRNAFPGNLLRLAAAAALAVGMVGSTSEERVSVEPIGGGELVRASFIDGKGASVKVDTAVFARDRVTLRVLDFRSGTTPRRGVIAALGRDGIAAVTGGFFDAARRPRGLLEVDGSVRHPVDRDFSGVIGSTRDGRPVLAPTAEIDTSRLRDAVQSRPLLVEADGHNGMRGDDGLLAIRTFALVGGDRIALGITSRCGLLDLATAMVEHPELFGVEHVDAALNLSGDASAGFAVRTPEGISSLPEGISIRNVLQISPRSE